MTSAHSQGIIEAALDCIIAMDEHGIVREFNPAAVRTFGYTREEAIGRRLGDLIVPPSLRDAHEHGFRRYLATGKTEVLGRRIELTAMRSDGSLLPVELAISRLEDGGGNRFVGFIRDLTELRDAELLYRTVIEHLPLAAYRNTANDQPATLYMSPQIEDMLGYPAEAWLGGADNGFYASVVHPGDLEHANATCAAARAAGVPFRLEYRMLHRDGTVVWVLDQSTIVRDESGAPLFAQGFLLDVTEQKRLEEQLRQSQKMEAIGQLAGGVAHDFNNMLTAISGYADLLAHSFDADDRRVDDVEQIRKAAGHAAALTRQLLAFGRKQMLRPQRLEVNDVVRDLEKMLARTIGGEVELQLSLADGLAPVETDPDQLVQVILNIALNGRDAMPGGGLLRLATVSVESGGDRYVAVEVTDTGTGIDEHVRNRLFEPFFTTKDQGKGTGLGLATAYGVVSQSGGRIEVETALGEGSTFRVLLPAAA